MNEPGNVEMASIIIIIICDKNTEQWAEWWIAV